MPGTTGTSLHSDLGNAPARAVDFTDVRTPAQRERRSSKMNLGPNPNGVPLASYGARPGAMTSVMRAVARDTGPRVLRVGIVQAGRVIDERIVKQRTNVTVGASEDATFVVATAVVPPQFKLFELVGGEYCLNFVDGMSGRVALASGVTELAALKREANRAGGAYQVKLTADARGRIVLGETTVLFQFVAPPPAQPRPQLPLAVKDGIASQIDWTLTMIAAFSFMLHFGAIGSLYSDWMDPIVENEVNFQGLIDLTGRLPPPIVETTPSVEPANPTQAPPAPSAQSVPQVEKVNPSPKRGVDPKTSEAREAALAARGDALRMAVLGSIVEQRDSVVAKVLDESNTVSADLTDAARNASRVVAAQGNLDRFGVGNEVVQPGHSTRLSDIAVRDGTGVDNGSGKQGAVPAGPRFDAVIDKPVSSDDIGAERVVSGLHGKFRACYNVGLRANSEMAGSVTMVAKVGPNGEVSSVSASENTGLSEPVVKCISHVLGDTSFRASASGSMLRLPIRFVKG